MFTPAPPQLVPRARTRAHRRVIETTDRRTASIDGLRGLAALSVFAFHAWLYTLPVVSASRRSTLGDFAVHELRLGLVLFFVLSGYLLFGPWARAAYLGTAPPTLGTYALRRAARIAPAYYLALAGSIALLWGLAGTPGVRLPPAESLPLFALFAQNTSSLTVLKLDPPMWTLAIEVSFYAILPLLGWLALRNGSRRAVIGVPVALIALGVGWNAMTSSLGLGMTFTKTLPAMIPYFALGMLATIAATHKPKLLGRHARSLLTGGVLLVLADAILQSLSAATASTIIPSLLRDLPAATGFAAIIAATVCNPHLSRILSSRPLTAVGSVSYGFYLWHVPVLLWLRGHALLPLTTVPAILVALPISLAIAALSWHLVEQPAIDWARRRRSPPPPLPRADVPRAKQIRTAPQPTTSR